MPKSGLSMANTVKVGQEMEKKFQANYFKLVEIVITLIFNSKQNVASIMQAVKSGNTNAALQEYAKANFNYYMSMKDDEGVLYINLAKDPITTVFFRNADELAKSGLRLHAGTIYITSISDVRLPYPQMEIVDTSGGAGAVAPANISKAANKAAKVALAQPAAAAATRTPKPRAAVSTPRARRT